MKEESKKKKLTAKERIIKILQWSKVTAKFIAVCSTIAGMVAAAASSSAATTGLALSAAGATTLAATKTIPSTRGYEKIKHIAPPRIIRSTKDSEKTSIDYSLWSDEKKQLKKAYSNLSV
jgi:hypothetical protein